MMQSRARIGLTVMACVLGLVWPVRAQTAPSAPASEVPTGAAGAGTPAAPEAPPSAAGSEPPAAPGAGTSSAAPEPPAPADTSAAPAPSPDAAPGDTATSSSPDDEQIIMDPELEGSAGGASLASSSPPLIGPSSDAQVRVVLHSRFAGDLRHEDPREEVWESTTLAAFDASVRRSEHLRFALGMRARYRYATLEHDVVDAHKDHHELDMLPTAAYADLTPASGLHVQVGWQGVHLGRFDIFSATNVLASSDLRDGPATMPEGATELGQLAALIDYDASTWLSLRAVYVPFFTPHLVALTESDYAIFPNTQKASEAALNGLAAGLPGGQEHFVKLVHDNLSRGDRERIAQSGLAALAPEPTFSSPQAALRGTVHGPSGELALTLGTALEHMPSFETNQALVDYAAEPTAYNQGFLLGGPSPVKVRYDRFFLVSVDGATNVGPVSIGAEAALMKDRTLYAERVHAATAGEGPLQPAHVDFAHFGVRAEYTASDQWLLALEAFAAYALSKPEDSVCKKPVSLVESNHSFSECRYMFLEGGRLLRGAAAIGSFSPRDLRLHFELSGALITGPSLVLAPRIGYAPWDDFEIEVGALFVEGATPVSTPEIAIGGVYDHVDQAFIGVRYQP